MLQFNSRRLLAGFLGACALVSIGSLPAPAATDSAVLRATLDNGLRVAIVRNPLAPVVTEVVNYGVGGQDTPAGFPGTAHAVEHMMFRSSAGLSTAQLANIGSLLGGNFNADTQPSITQFFFTMPAEYLDVALKIEATRMSGLLATDAEWNQERGAIEQEVSSDESSTFFRFYQAALKALFAGTPYAESPLGTRASFDKTTGVDLFRFQRTWYAPNNAILVICGDVDPPKTLALVRATFGAIPKRAVPSHRAVKPGPVKGETLSLESDLPVPVVAAAYRTPGYTSPDVAAAEIASDVLNSERGKLYALRAEGKALAAGVSVQTLEHAGLGFAYIVTPPGADLAAARKLLFATIGEYRTGGVPDELVEAAKRKEIAQAQFNRNSIDGLATEWSQALAVEGLQSPDDRLARIEKVTKADVDRVLAQYFTEGQAVVGVLTPKAAGGAEGGKGYGGKESFAPSDPKPVVLPIWARSLEKLPSVPVAKLTPVDLRLANGIRLIVQPTSISPTVTVRGAVRQNPDLQTPPAKEGVDSVLGRLFSYGTTSLDRIAFRTALDDIAADLSGGSTFSLAVPAANFDRGVALLADDLLHPALPPAAFDIVRRQTSKEIAGEIESPDYISDQTLQRALYPKGDPALREATPASVDALALDDVKSYFATTFRPDMTTIVIAGDVTPEAAKASVERWFGAWTASGPRPQTEYPAVALNGPASAVVPATGRKQSEVALEELVGITRANPDYYALRLGNTILGGGFYATRFYRDLRKDSGLVYSVGAGLKAGKTRSSYSVQFGSDPQKVAKARAIVDRDLRDIGTKNVTPQELRLAKTTLVRDFSLAESNVDAVAAGYLARSLADLPLDEPVRQARILLALDADAIRLAFKRWIDPARFVQIVTGPAPK
jgi:zinc protease